MWLQRHQIAYNKLGIQQPYRSIKASAILCQANDYIIYFLSLSSIVLRFNNSIARRTISTPHIHPSQFPLLFGRGGGGWFDGGFLLKDTQLIEDYVGQLIHTSNNTSHQQNCASFHRLQFSPRCIVFFLPSSSLLLLLFLPCICLRA